MQIVLDHQVVTCTACKFEVALADDKFLHDHLATVHRMGPSEIMNVLGALRRTVATHRVLVV